MVICLERGADLHMAQLMLLPLTVSCFSKIQIGFTFLVPAHLGSPGKGPLNGCVCVVVSRVAGLPLGSDEDLVMTTCRRWRWVSTGCRLSGDRRRGGDTVDLTSPAWSTHHDTHITLLAHTAGPMHLPGVCLSVCPICPPHVTAAGLLLWDRMAARMWDF